MPSENRLPNVPIPLPLALYVIPLVFMAEYIAQQLWGLIHQSIEEEDLSPPPSSPSPLSLLCGLCNQISSSAHSSVV